MKIENVNVKLLIDTFIAIEITLNANMSWEAKHHKIFYENMSVRKLYEADPSLMEGYLPAMASTRTECEQLWEFCINKVNYLKGITS
jgi:hypothetical protein